MKRIKVLSLRNMNDSKASLLLFFIESLIFHFDFTHNNSFNTGIKAKLSLISNRLRIKIFKIEMYTQ